MTTQTGITAAELAEIAALTLENARKMVAVREAHRAQRPDVDTSANLDAMRALTAEIEADANQAAAAAARNDAAGAMRARTRAGNLGFQVRELNRLISLTYRADTQMREWEAAAQVQP